MKVIEKANQNIKVNRRKVLSTIPQPGRCRQRTKSLKANCTPQLVHKLSTQNF